MTGYTGLILFIVSFYATINFFRIFSISRRIFHLCIGSSAIFLSIIGISGYLSHFFPVLDPEFINDWATVFAVSFILTAAAALIRESKPVFARFPRFFTFIPMLLVFFYPLIMNTVVLKSWVFVLYQGCAIIIGILIYGYRTSINSRYGYMLIAVIFFLITYILYWLPSSIFTLPVYGWALMVSSGILILTVGYNQIYQREIEHAENMKEEDKWFI